MSKPEAVTLQLKQVSTFELRVDIAIPPEKPQVRGHFFVDALPRTRDEVKKLQDRGLSDEEYLREIAHDIRGLGDASGAALVGDAAFKAVLDGEYGMYLLPAIIGAYFEHFGEARRKNALPQRGR